MGILKIMIFIFILSITWDKWKKLFLFFYWKFVDVYRFFRYPEKRRLHLFGIWLYCGLYGQGKTMGLTEYLTRMRKRYGDKIYIATNYGFKDEDFSINSWHDLLPDYDRPVIFGYDEIQNEFNSRDYKNFPYELVRLLTQNRKGNGKQIVGTAQRYNRVDKVIRELCSHIIECRTRFGRYTKTKSYDADDYEEMLHQVDVLKKRKVPCRRYSFIQSDALRDAYDSFKMLESAKSKDYVSLHEKMGLKDE